MPTVHWAGLGGSMGRHIWQSHGVSGIDHFPGKRLGSQKSSVPSMCLSASRAHTHPPAPQPPRGRPLASFEDPRKSPAM